jgi:hypothetical protein
MTTDRLSDSRHSLSDAQNGRQGGHEQAGLALFEDAYNAGAYSLLNGWNRTVGADEAKPQEKAEEKPLLTLEMSDVFMASKLNNQEKSHLEASRENEDRKEASAVVFTNIYPDSVAGTADKRFDDMVNNAVLRGQQNKALAAV